MTLYFLDVRSLAAPAGPNPGPLASRFRSLGGLDEGNLVAGPWGDLSSDLHNLLRCFAEARCARISRARAWVGDVDGLLGKVMGDTTRATGIAVVRAQATGDWRTLSQVPGPGSQGRRPATTSHLEVGGAPPPRSTGFPASSPEKRKGRTCIRRIIICLNTAKNFCFSSPCLTYTNKWDPEILDVF